MEINIGVSSCLLGYKVRYDGSYKSNDYIIKSLSEHFNLIPVCPETEVGMGIPRERVNLIGSIENPRLIGEGSEIDWTSKMNRYTREKAILLKDHNLRGYIFKSGSPSCGLEKVKLYGEEGNKFNKIGMGLFAKQLIQYLPLLPVIDENKLNDFDERENFIVRVFAYDRLLNVFEKKFKRGDVIEFHSVHKYLIMAHSQKHYKLMGQLVAAIKNYNPVEFKGKYTLLFMEALKIRSTKKKNVNVLQHIMGYLKRDLSVTDKKYISNIIDDYRNQLVPLIVPITLIRYFIEKHQVEYISSQYYLNPHSKELMLRNHV